MKSVTYALIGLFIGAAFGAMVGFGNTYYTKKSEKEAEGNIQVPVWAVVGALVCAGIGASLGAEVDKEEKSKRVAGETSGKLEREGNREARLKKILGFDNAETKYEGDGEQLVGSTTWVDSRNRKVYELKTHIEKEVYGTRKFVDYVYTTTFKGKVVVIARDKHANRVTMERIHNLYRNVNFSRMYLEFSADSNFSVERFFQEQIERP